MPVGMTGRAAETASPMNAAAEVLGGPGDPFPDHLPAIRHRDRSLSRGDLRRLVAGHAQALTAAGVGRGDRVLFLLDDSPELVAAYLAVIGIGAVAIAYNTRAAARDLRFVLDDSGARLLFIESALLPLYREIEDSLGRPVQPVVRGAPEAMAAGPALALEEFATSRPERFEPVPMASDEMAFWIYTSGTTGHPKAAVHRHRDVLLADRHLRENLGVEPGDRILCSSKLFFAYALGHLLLGGLRAGATLVLFDGWPDAERVARQVERHRPDHFFSVPTFYRNLLRDGQAARPAFRAIRHCVSAGEALPAALYQAWLETTGRPVLEGIGTTESIFLFIANTPRRHRPGSSGRPLPWAEVQLRDEAGEPVTQPDAPGILWLRMESVCDGYWNRPEATGDAFRDGWYRTGDVFTRDRDGWWHHQGRADNMLKISGQWVSPAEIEECVLEVPGVVEAALIGVPDADGLVRITLFVVADAADRGEETLQREIQARLRRCLSIYKCPRQVRFIDAIPRTDTGKMQKYKLQALLAEQAGRASDGPDNNNSLR